MNKKKSNERRKILAVSSLLCVVGVAFASNAPVESQDEKFKNLNNDAAGIVKTTPQLSLDEVAALGKKDGVGGARMLGSIKAIGFQAAGKTEVRGTASAEEIAEKAAAKKSRGLHGSVKGGNIMSLGKIERVNVGVDDFNDKGSAVHAEAPDGFVKTKETR